MTQHKLKGGKFDSVITRSKSGWNKLKDLVPLIAKEQKTDFFLHEYVVICYMAVTPIQLTDAITLERIDERLFI